MLCLQILEKLAGVVDGPLAISVGYSPAPETKAFAEVGISCITLSGSLFRSLLGNMRYKAEELIGRSCRMRCQVGPALRQPGVRVESPRRAPRVGLGAGDSEVTMRSAVNVPSAAVARPPSDRAGPMVTRRPGAGSVDGE